MSDKTEKNLWQRLYDLGYQSYAIDRLIESDLLTINFLEHIGRYYEYRSAGNTGFEIDISRETRAIIDKLDLWTGDAALALEGDVSEYLESFVGPLGDEPDMQQGDFLDFIEWHKSQDQYGRPIGDFLDDRDGKEFHPNQIIGNIQSDEGAFSPKSTRGEVEPVGGDDYLQETIEYDLSFIKHKQTLEKKIAKDLRGIGEAETISDKIRKDLETTEQPQNLAAAIAQDLRSYNHER